MTFQSAQRVADAVLWEGYVLYPYRASSSKNRFRWQFGVLVPAGYEGEPSTMQTECLVEAGARTAIDLRLRFLQVQTRTVEEAMADGSFRPAERLQLDHLTLVSWEEGVEQHLDAVGMALTELLASERVLELHVVGGREESLVHGADGRLGARVVRERWPLSVMVRVSAEHAGRAVRLRAVVENTTPCPPEACEQRALALRHSLNGAHTLLAAKRGRFVSLLDPPAWAAAEAAACANRGTWPVLVGQPGEEPVVLSSPIVLYDYPEIAPESPGDLFDATEIDEILSLRIMTLTEEEKREARATDERARAVVDRTETLPTEVFERLHGAIRHLGAAVAPPRGDRSRR
ncbi:MAG: hypothetical protein ACTHM9_14475 [Gemmatimonadales bacterium]